MPSIWITSKSRPERSDAIQSFMRAADSATKRREAADFDRPAPPPRAPGTSSRGKRNRAANSGRGDFDRLLFQAPLPEPAPRTCRPPPRYRLLLPVKAAKPWPLVFALAAGEADLALLFPPAVRPPV